MQSRSEEHQMEMNKGCFFTEEVPRFKEEEEEEEEEEAEEEFLVEEVEKRWRECKLPRRKSRSDRRFCLNEAFDPLIESVKYLLLSSVNREDCASWVSSAFFVMRRKRDPEISI
jgi:hypothetical protein